MAALYGTGPEGYQDGPSNGHAFNGVDVFEGTGAMNGDDVFLGIDEPGVRNLFYGGDVW